MNEYEWEKKYLEEVMHQSSALPKTVKDRLIEGTERWGDLQYYALSDISESGNFEESWAVLTAKSLLIFQADSEKGRIKLLFEESRSLVTEVKEDHAVSGNQLIFFTKGEVKPLYRVRYTGVQKIAMSNLKYFLEEDLIPEIRQDELDKHFRTSCLKPIRDARKNINVNERSTLFRLLSYLLPYKKQLSVGLTGAIFLTATNLVPGYLSGYLVDNVVRPFENGKLEFGEASSIAWILVLAMAVTYGLKEFFIWVRLRWMSKIGEYVARDLRHQLYSHLQKLGMDFFGARQTGSIISRVSSDTDRLWDFIAFGVIEAGMSILNLMGLSTVLIALDWKLGLLMTVPVPLMIYAIYRHGVGMNKLFLAAWRKWSDMTAVLSDTIPGIQVVKVFNQEKRETARFNSSNEKVTDTFLSIHDNWTRFWPVLFLGIHALTIGVWFMAVPRLINQGEATLTTGTFISFLLYMTMFHHPIEVIGQMARMMNRALSSAYRIFEILDTRPSLLNKGRIRLQETEGGRITFENVSFSYDGIRKILKNVELEIKAGEMIGLVGPSGGGKSTITKLVARFYDPQSGRITLDGHNLRDIEMSDLRGKIGMVLQEPYLFHGSLVENIRYGRPDATLKEVIEAAQVANAHDFIMKLPKAYDTVVGERGHTLSGGERQRVSIARAILHDPKILILDEATSAVDTETERKIQEALDRLVEGRTVIAVAHRLSTLRKANRILVIKDGVIEEQGTHSELLEKPEGQYRKLHEMQREMNENFAL